MFWSSPGMRNLPSSQVLKLSLWCFKFKPFGYFRHRWYCPRWEAFPCPSGGTAILSRDGEPTPDVSLKVRLCLVYPLQWLHTSCRCVVRLPQLLRLALPNTLHARISSVSYSHFLCTSSCSDICSCAEFLRWNIRLMISSGFAWRRKLGFGMMLARRGEKGMGVVGWWLYFYHQDGMMQRPPWSVLAWFSALSARNISLYHTKHSL